MSKMVMSDLVRLFESDQKQWDTEIAIHNLVFLLATDMLHTIGVKKTSVTQKKSPVRQRKQR